MRFFNVMEGATLDTPPFVNSEIDENELRTSSALIEALGHGPTSVATVSKSPAVNATDLTMTLSTADFSASNLSPAIAKRATLIGADAASGSKGVALPFTMFELRIGSSAVEVQVGLPVTIELKHARRRGGSSAGDETYHHTAELTSTAALIRVSWVGYTIVEGSPVLAPFLLPVRTAASNAFNADADGVDHPDFDLKISGINDQYTVAFELLS